MPMIAFFPWFAVSEQRKVGQIVLEPFVRETGPGLDADTQNVLDMMLEPYCENPQLPVQRATIVRLEGHDFLDELDEDDREDVFLFSELLALAGLGSRGYFSHRAYVNTANCEVVIQRFQDPTNGPTIRARRRDGFSTMAHLDRELYRVTRPAHVPHNTMDLELDWRFLETLWEARRTDIGARIVEATSSFTRANTDAPTVHTSTEIVLTVGAFETLLDVRQKAKEHALADPFTSLWSPTLRVSCEESSRVKDGWGRNAASISETWIRDLFQHRGFHAHGRLSVAGKRYWQTHEHLLLSSYVFPLLTKLVLAQAQLYELDEDEQYAIDVFEKLADADLFTATDEHAIEFPWTDIWCKNRFAWMWEQKHEEWGFGGDAQQDEEFDEDDPEAGAERQDDES